MFELSLPLGQLPNVATLAWAGVVGLGLFLFGAAQPFGRPRRDLGQRLAQLDPEQRLRLDRQAAERQGELDPYQRQPLSLLLAPVADEIGHMLMALLQRMGIAGVAELEEALRIAWPEHSVVQFYGLRVQMVVVALLPLALGNLLHLDLGPGVAWAIVLGIAGFLSPSLMLQQRLRAHQERVSQELGDLLTLMTVCLRGGLSVEQSVAEAARQSRGPLGRQLRRMQGELAHGTSFREALEHVAYNVGVAEVRRTVQYIQASSSLGTPLEDALRQQADSLREARRQAVVRRGIRASIVMLLPVGLMLVAAFVVLLAPAVMQLNATGGS
jgi:hypothetical protein